MTMLGIKDDFCPCHKIPPDNPPVFEKVADLKYAGLVIYHHSTGTQQVPDTGINVGGTKPTEDVFILHNVTDTVLKPIDFLPEMESKQVSCARCRKLINHALKLLREVPAIDNNDIITICDHCKLKEQPCYDCDETMKLFLDNTTEESKRYILNKKRVKEWVYKIPKQSKHFLPEEKESDKYKKRALSELRIDKLCRFESDKGERKLKIEELLDKAPEVLTIPSEIRKAQRLYIPKNLKFDDADYSTTLVTGREEILTSDKIQYDENSINTYLENYQKAVEKFDGGREVGQTFESKAIGESSLAKSKNKHDQSITLDEKRLPSAALKRQYIHLKDEIPMTSQMKSARSSDVENLFSFHFLKDKNNKKMAHGQISSSVLIKDTHDMLQEKAEAKKKTLEEKLRNKTAQEITSKENLKLLDRSQMEAKDEKEIADGTTSRQKIKREVLTSKSQQTKIKLEESDAKLVEGKSETEVKRLRTATKKSKSETMQPKSTEVIKSSIVKKTEMEAKQTKPTIVKETTPKTKSLSKKPTTKSQVDQLVPETKSSKSESSKAKSDLKTPESQSKQTKPKSDELKPKSPQKSQTDIKKSIKPEQKDLKTATTSPKSASAKTETKSKELASSPEPKGPKSETATTKLGSAKSEPKSKELASSPEPKGSKSETASPKSASAKSEPKSKEPKAETASAKSASAKSEPKSKESKAETASPTSGTAKSEPKSKEPKAETASAKSASAKSESKSTEPMSEPKETKSEQKEPISEQKEPKSEQKDHKSPQKEPKSAQKESKSAKKKALSPQKKPQSAHKEPQSARKGLKSAQKESKLAQKEPINETKGTDDTGQIQPKPERSKTKSKHTIESEKQKKQETQFMKEIAQKSKKNESQVKLKDTVDIIGEQKKPKQKDVVLELRDPTKIKEQNALKMMKAQLANEGRKPRRKQEEPQPIKKKKELGNLNIKKIKMLKPSQNTMALEMVKFKKKQRPLRLSEIMSPMEIELHEKHHKTLKGEHCLMCIHSDLALDYECTRNRFHDYPAVINRLRILKYKPSFNKKPQDLHVQPLFFETISHFDENIPEAKGDILSDEKGNLEKPEPDPGKGVIRYALSDRTFIDKGWTMLPTEKVVRKMNVYRMRPAHPEFDWFEHNKNKRLINYDTDERLAEFDDDGRGNWFYRNGRTALQYYDAEELNAQQRFVIYSNGEPDERGRSRPYTVLATFDYLGNGVVFDHSGKIRLKYNQTEGVVLDRNIGPVSHWKWHTLNDPPVLQQVMIDTHMGHKDPEILKMGGPQENIPRPDNEEMLTIEFDNFIKEKSKKLRQSFKPFQIRMKALKLNEHFSLKVLDQANIYLIFRDGTTNLKVNIGMILDHKEIIDTDTAEVGEVSNNLERFPARTDSVAALQKSVAYAQRFERTRTERERRLRPPEPCASADKLVAAASRPMSRPFRTVNSSSALAAAGKSYCKSRKPTSFNVYYDNRLL